MLAYQNVFEKMGYTTCEDEDAEEGVERVAIFMDARGMFKHVARQLPTGRWSSKLGAGPDIEHELRALEGPEYGQVAVLMRRGKPDPE